MVRMHDPLGDRPAKTKALATAVASRIVGPVEPLEDVGQGLFRNPRPSVRYSKDAGAASLCYFDRDLGGSLRGAR